MVSARVIMDVSKFTLPNFKWDDLISMILNTLATMAAEFYKKEAPVWEGEFKPQGQFRDSIQTDLIQKFVKYVKSDSDYLRYIQRGHEALVTPGQVRWFHAHYPNGYQRVAPGPPGYVDPDDFDENAFEKLVSGNIIEAIATLELQKFMDGERYTGTYLGVSI